MPTVQDTDHFDHAIDAGYYTDGFFGTPTGVATPVYAAETASLQIVTDGGNQGVRHNISGSPTRGWAGFALRFEDLPAPGDTVFICTFGTVDGVVPALACGGNGIFATIGGDNGAEFNIAADTWYWVEAIADVSEATREILFRVEGVDGDPAQSIGSATTITWHQQISLAGDDAGNTSWRAYWQYGSAANDTDWQGEPAAPGTVFVPRPSMASRGTSW